MSGEIGLLFALPLALPLAVGGAAIHAAGMAGSAAVHAIGEYEQKRRQERELIRSTGIGKEVDSFRTSAKELMKEQKRQNQELSREFEASVQRQREAFTLEAARMLEAPEEFARELKTSASEMTALMDQKQRALQKEYRDAIARTLVTAEEESTRRMGETMDEIASLYADEAEKEKRMAQAASEYLEEARDLLEALTRDFHGEAYLGSAVALHKVAYQEAADAYNRENYEGCLTAAAALLAKIRHDILNADEKHQEFENWQKTASILIAENQAMMESMQTLTPELYQLLQDYCIENDETFSLTEDLIGVDLSAFWGITVEGRPLFAVMMQQLAALSERVLSAENPLTTEELKQIAEAMSGEWRVQIARGMKKAMTRFNNALQREYLSQRMITELEEMGYTYRDYRYLRTLPDGSVEASSDEDIDAHLCMTFLDAYGDEILIELSNSGDSAIDLQITDMAEEVDPDVDKSRSRGEMEQAIRDIVAGSVPGERRPMVSGGCKAGTEHRVVTNPVNRRKKQLVEGQ
ncbi:MAG: hypothetical protein LUI87_13215 [Lachnospiraceae bacterium]|nr:hypothetical protein [Lachnospiraceae bacterium]